MHTHDFLTALLVATVASVCLFFKFYALALFGAFLFVLLIVNMVCFYMTQPLPRSIMSIGFTKEDLSDILAQTEDKETPNE